MCCKKSGCHGSMNVVVMSATTLSQNINTHHHHHHHHHYHHHHDHHQHYHHGSLNEFLANVCLCFIFEAAFATIFLASCVPLSFSLSDQAKPSANQELPAKPRGEERKSCQFVCLDMPPSSSAGRCSLAFHVSPHSMREPVQVHTNKE